MKTTNTETLGAALAVAIEAAKEAGALLLAERKREGGPRGGGHHADVDEEAERLIRQRLLGWKPGWGYRGEETGEQELDRTGVFWLVDPNDGTSAYLKAWRGSAVSIALIDGGEPVLGVVFAFAAPDDGGDLIAWAEGSALTRNGRSVGRAPLPDALDRKTVVMLNQDHEQHPEGSAEYVRPGRFRCMPSIAYRLALVAAGDADATVATGGPTDWDVAAGHALLRGAGGELVDERGRPVRYGRRFDGNVYGGSEPVAVELSRRGRARWESTPPRLISGLGLAQPRWTGATVDTGLLRRAQGCLLGQLAGDALGQLVEFERANTIARKYPLGVRDLADGGAWDTLAGQPTDDSEMALTLARALVRDGAHDRDRMLRLYSAWLESPPFDVGGTTRAGIRGTPRLESESNGSLMRVSPLGVWAHGLDDASIAALARAESAVTHPNAVCRDACAVFCVAIAHGLRGEGRREVYEAARRFAREGDACAAVRAAVDAAESAPPADMYEDMGHVTLALQNAFFQLLHAESLEEALVSTVGMGGDTDTTAAIAGALLGAVMGREAVPARWQRAVLSCRPMAGSSGVRRPRPATYWPVDALVLAERLVSAGPSAAPMRL